MAVFNKTDEGQELELTGPQTEFFLCEEPYPLFCAGFGAGKSQAMGICVLNDVDIAPGVRIGAYAPTFDLLRLITLPYLEELLETGGYPYKLNKSENIFYLSDNRQIICRSMDNPNRIIGYQTLRAHVDELDTLREDQAENAWNKIIARNRQKVIVDGQIVRNGVRAYSTPEGFRFAYKRWVQKQTKGYKIVRAPTYSNPHLPPEYIDNLRASYPEQLIDAYIEGEFVNLTAGAVYKGFKRELNTSTETVQGNEPLDVGMDFNIEHGAASICVDRGDRGFHVVDEIHDSYDTDDTIRVLKERYPNNPIRVYPDASGKKRSSGGSNGVNTRGQATSTDLYKLQKAGFTIVVDYANPLIKDRVAAVNAKICNGKGERTLFINAEKAPNHINTLEQQVYSNGLPDKSAGLDHIGDALGYVVVKKFPIVKQFAGFGGHND